MVLCVARFEVLPDKVKEYEEWIKNFLELPLAVREVVEFRAYRTLVPSKGHIVATYEFKNLETWAKWYSNNEFQKFLDELKKFVTNFAIEIWGPSPHVPEPVRPEYDSLN